MTDTSLEATPMPTDPRVGAALDFAQSMLAGYTELASVFLEAIPDPTVRARLNRHTQDVLGHASARYADVLTGKAKTP